LSCLQAQREVIKAEHPDITFGEIGRLLGERWGAISEEEKKIYTKQAEADKARYEKEMKAYKRY